MSGQEHTVRLSDGHLMPLVGLGTWQSSEESEVEEALRAALDAGYRHIDTAYVYQNEQHIGNALKKIFQEGNIKRSDLFIVTKLPSNGMAEQYVEYFLRKSLAALQLDYVDLYLVHSPFYAEKKENDDEYWSMTDDGVYARGPDIDIRDTWKAMESLVEKKLAKSIGLSNFNSKQIQRILDCATIKPSNLQVECHAYLPQYELQKFCNNNGISFTAYSPLGSPGLGPYFKKNYGKEAELPNLLEESKLKPISERHGKTTAQILLRYLVQRGIVVIPKSSNPDRIKQNIDIFDFTLTSEEMEIIKSMANGFRYFKFDIIPGLTEHPEYPFHEPF